MARPFVAPDPNDRSPNEPTMIASLSQVLGLYNQANVVIPNETSQSATAVPTV